MVWINEEGYIEHKGRFTTLKKKKRIKNDIFLVKVYSSWGKVVPMIRLGDTIIKLPKIYGGKRVKLKLEVVDSTHE